MEYNNITHIANYEMKMLTRDWSFKVITLISILLVAALHLISQSNLQSPEWIAISLPSAIPFANAYLVNYLQVVITIFWAGNFIYKKQRVDSSSSIQVRPFTNTDLLWGKTLGFILVLFGLDLLLALVALLIHVCISDSPFAWYPYLFYLFTRTLPTLVFMTGLTICVKGLVKSKSIASGLLLGFLYFEAMHGTRLFQGAIDVFATSLPNGFSDATGFSRLNLYLLHRLAFLAWGGGLITLGIYLIRRIPNTTKIPHKIGGLGILMLLLGCTFSWIHVNTFTREQQNRKTCREIFIQHENTLKARVANHDLQFAQNGNSFRATSKLLIHNPNEQALSSIIIYLNPGLKIDTLTLNGDSMAFKREKQVIQIDMPLQPDEQKEIYVQYHGTISPEVCYAEIEDLNSLAETRSYYIFNMGKEFFYLQPDFTLLTPECLWYPTTLPPVNVHSPYTTLQGYTRYQLTIVGEKKRIPISQGEMSSRGDTTRFTNLERQTGLSLCIGDYSRDTIKIDSIQFETYLFKGHEYLTEDFTIPKEIIQSWISSLDYYDQKYTFHKLALVETPVHFCAYSRPWKTGSEYTQPEIIFRPEREALISSALKIQAESMNPGVPPEAECFSAYTNNYTSSRSIYTGNLFLDPLSKHTKVKDTRNEHDISTLLQKHHVHVFSSEFPGIDVLFQEMQGSWKYAKQGYQNCFNPIEAIEYLKNTNLADIFNDRQHMLTFQQISRTKSCTFLRRVLCDVPYQAFHDFTRAFITRHSFQDVCYEKYCTEFQKQFGIDLIVLTRQLYTEKSLPSFLVRDVHIQQVECPGEEIGFVQSVKVWNTGNVDGVITLTGPHFPKDVNYLIHAGACKEIRNYFKEQPTPVDLEIQTNTAQNIPARFIFKEVTPHSITRDPRPGIFDADTTLFAPAPNEFIVDNEDDGFHIFESGQALTQLLRKTKEDKIASGKYRQWEYSLYDQGGYGEPVRSYYKKLAGNGNSMVEWETRLPEAGEYELFVYYDENMLNRNGNIKTYINQKQMISPNPTQTYVFTHAGGEEKIVLENENASDGWVSLGTYSFPSGKAKITLPDLGSGPYQAILADAVKWVKRTKHPR